MNFKISHKRLYYMHWTLCWMCVMLMCRSVHSPGSELPSRAFVHCGRQVAEVWWVCYPSPTKTNIRAGPHKYCLLIQSSTCHGQALNSPNTLKPKAELISWPVHDAYTWYVVALGHVRHHVIFFTFLPLNLSFSSHMSLLHANYLKQT